MQSKDGNVDAAFETLGPLRLYNMVQYCLLLTTAWSTAMNMFSVVFTGQHNPFKCRRTPSIFNDSKFKDLSYWNLSESATEEDFDSTCNIKHFHDVSGNISLASNSSLAERCSAFDVDFLYPKDMYFVSEFYLVCERKYLIGISQLVLTAGQGIAMLLFPYFTDRYGRRPVLLLSCVFMFGSSLGLACSVNYGMFVAFKLLIGFFLQGMEAAAVTAIMETLVTRHRAFLFACMGSLNWTLSCLLLTPVAYFLRHHSWRILEFTIAAVSVNIIPIFFLLDETLRWLAANGKDKQISKVLKRASKWNGVDLKRVTDAFYPPDSKDSDLNGNASLLCTFTNDSNNSERGALSSKDARDNFVKHPVASLTNGISLRKDAPCDLFKDPMLRRHTLFNVVAWFFNSFTYFALILMSSTLHGSIYANYTLNAVAEIPQAIFCFFYLDKIGRRRGFALFSIIAGVALIAVATVWELAPDQGAAITALSIIGKVGITGSFNVIYLYTPELFPTNLRNMGLGVSYLSARFGGMLSPFAELLMEKIVYAPGLVFGISSLAMSVMPFFLPETTKYQLPQSLAEMKLWKRPQGGAASRRRVPGQTDGNKTEDAVM
ncbi:solute carrier family 22 member 15-like [Aplysia californica]|uniref:Solute carrier family 22 member 15-like n=1 Tax=Aplysia californica TaxID=6500 RepID=A0ABM1A039_APLCA|nr:solute carrier family 22 member 15-like [Aplysia californica]